MTSPGRPHGERMRLYDSQPSGNCYKVRLLLAHLGIDVERVPVDIGDQASRRKLLHGRSPALRVPVLELADGRCLAESNAILWYLGDGTPWVPADPFARAQVLQWLFFEQYSHEPYIAVLRHRAMVGTLDSLPDLDDRRRRGRLALEALDEGLADRRFLVGDRCSIADVALYAYTHVADEGGFDLAPHAAVRAWLARVAAVPGHITIDG